jgi:hypothetical protein
MQGDFSRWTFDRRDGYRSVLLQQGRVLLDADWNEQTQITAHHDEVRMRDALGRAGGPLGEAAFGITDAAGAAPAGKPWADLRLTPGRFYVDGVLAEVEPGAGGAGTALAKQPFLPGDAPLGLPEPSGDGRYAVVLDVWTDHVTADEAPRLRESALGGPDTTTRARTVWQVRLRKVGASDACSAVTGADWLRDTPATMTASLQDVAPDADPCRITTSAGYRRLENQLYRVQIHDVDKNDNKKARYLWSRENGSVVAGLTGIRPTAVAGMDKELVLDREGRDEELSIGPADIVEVTSADLRLHGLPGYLARTGAVVGTTVPVEWIGDEAKLADLGRAPIVRRWEAEPKQADATPDELEDGIQVRFTTTTTSTFRPGDHWMIPARTVRLVYGQSALAGTIDWPKDNDGKPIAQPPSGPVHHRAVVALLDRTTTGGKGAWTLKSDCRRLTPPLTAMVGIDLLGGDGQEAKPGKALDAPVRVVVRNGAVPVSGAMVRFTAADGHLVKAGTPGTGDPAELDVETGANGQAQVWWLLKADGSPTQLLTASLLDDGPARVGAEVQVSARLSVSDEIAYDPANCSDLAAAGAKTVREAIDALCARPSVSFPGIHVTSVISVADKKRIENDTGVLARRLAKGIAVDLDTAIAAKWAKEPVMRVTVDVPWPVDAAEREVWGDAVVGTQTVALDGEIRATSKRLIWTPATRVVPWLDRLIAVATAHGLGRVLTRVTVLGNVLGSAEQNLFLNGRAFGKLLDDGRIALQLPSVDDVHGADFSMWFWLEPEPVRPPQLLVDPMALHFFRGGTAVVRVANVGGEAVAIEVSTRTSSSRVPNRFSATPASATIQPDAEVELTVTAETLTRGLSATGILTIDPDHPDLETINIPLETTGSPELRPLVDGIIARRPELREEVELSLNPPEGEDPGLDKLKAALEDRGEPLRVAVLPGGEDAFIALRDEFEAKGIEVVRVSGNAAGLIQLANSGRLVLDAVVSAPGGGGALAATSGGALLPPLRADH